MKLFKFVWILSAVALAACAQTSSNNQPGQEPSASLSANASGPSSYHATYAAIQTTTVTIQNFRLRTSDGQVVSIATAPMQVNLQDLIGIGKGLRIDLQNVALPNAAASIDVAEIETSLLSGDIQSADGSSCELKIPRRLNFFNAAPVTLFSGQVYLLKLQFAPLAHIQLDVVADGADCDSNSSDNSQGLHHKSKHHEDSTDDASRLSCELANHRYPISQLVRPADEI